MISFRESARETADEGDAILLPQLFYFRKTDVWLRLRIFVKHFQIRSAGGVTRLGRVGAKTIAYLLANDDVGAAILDRQRRFSWLPAHSRGTKSSQPAERPTAPNPMPTT